MQSGGKLEFVIFLFLLCVLFFPPSCLQLQLQCDIDNNIHSNSQLWTIITFQPQRY